jgi:hypothetical protein
MDLSHPPVDLPRGVGVPGSMYARFFLRGVVNISAFGLEGYVSVIRRLMWLESDIVGSSGFGLRRSCRVVWISDVSPTSDFPNKYWGKPHI